VLFRSAGGSDDLANLTSLCAAHHQRCVHEGVLPLGRFRSGDRAIAFAP
jgi:hypothetical protein